MFYYCFGMVGTGHKSGFVYRGQPKHYLLMHFRNDFFVEADGKMLQGKGGSLVLHRPGSTLAHGSAGKRVGFINDWLFFDADSREAEFLKELPFDIPIPTENGGDFINCLSQILSENLRNDAFSRQLISQKIFQMLVLISRGGEDLVQTEDSLYRRFDGYRHHFREHCRQPWSLERMATYAGYSTSHFSARYKEIFGISPMEDLLQERLELAKRLLRLKTYQVQEIAEMCGFSSLHYFSEFFKKRTGKSPRGY